MKVLFFAHAMQGRGTERGLVRLLAHFDREKVSPTLALVSARGSFLSRVPDDVVVHELAPGATKTMSALPALLRLVRRERFDCLVSVHISAARTLGLLRVIRPNTPLVCMETDPFARIEGEKGHYRARRLVSSLTYRRANLIVAASDVVRDDLVREAGVRPGKIRVVPLPCVDEELYRLAKEPPAHDLDSSVPTVVTVGNMFAHKDQKTLLRAFARLASRRPCRLVVVGEGPLRAELEAFARELGVGELVLFTGFVDNPFSYLAAATVFASSSVSEGFDISQVEAMACGTPVVVTDAPRFAAVRDGVNGIVVPPGDPEAMAGALDEVLGDPALRDRVTAAAKDVAEGLSAARIAARYEDLLEDVAG